MPDDADAEIVVVSWITLISADRTLEGNITVFEDAAVVDFVDTCCSMFEERVLDVYRKNGEYHQIQIGINSTYCHCHA